jgi:hypothetical protein
MLDSDATLTHDEILERFKKLFNREMTPEERRGFFLVESSDRPPKATKIHSAAK